MYPRLDKKLYQSPYIEMFYCLGKEWEDKDVFIVIGYSFRDDIIKNIFINGLKKCNKKRIILVHPVAETIRDNMFKDYASQIIPITSKFGEKDNYQGVNESIKNCLNTINI
jgi:hypothetical protein